MSDQQDSKDIANVTTRPDQPDRDPANVETGEEPDVASIERIYRSVPYLTYQDAKN